MGWPAPQVLKPGFSGEVDRDRLMVFDGAYIINDTTQVPLTDAILEVTVNLLNLKTGAEDSLDVEMNISTDNRFYYIDLDVYTALKAKLLDKTKFVASIVERGWTNMRTFTVDEFAVDYGELEAVLSTKAYQFEDLGTANAKIVWYDSVSDMASMINPRFEAPVYEGGTGTTRATRPEKVTHRGPISSV